MGDAQLLHPRHRPLVTRATVTKPPRRQRRQRRLLLRLHRPAGPTRQERPDPYGGSVHQKGS